jgi:hypothetical protein
MPREEAVAQAARDVITAIRPLVPQQCCWAAVPRVRCRTAVCSCLSLGGSRLVGRAHRAGEQVGQQAGQQPRVALLQHADGALQRGRALQGCLLAAQPPVVRARCRGGGCQRPCQLGMPPQLQQETVASAPAAMPCDVSPQPWLHCN